MQSSINHKQLKLVIFDMDGLMFETGRIAYSAYLKNAKKYDFEMIHDVYYALTGRTNASIIEGMKEMYGEENDVIVWREAIVKERNYVTTHATTVGKKPGLVELIQYLKENNILIAVASSSDKAVIERYLKLESLEGLFDAIISGDMVTQGKPDPEVFLKACEELNVSSEDAVVLEDSVVGVKASKNAGINVFLIRDDIYDLPTYEGKIKIRNPIVLEEETPTKEFKSLFEVKQYLED